MNEDNSVPVYNYGWSCPKCGAVYAPFVSECYRCNGYQTPIVTCETSKPEGPQNTGGYF